MKGPEARKMVVIFFKMLKVNKSLKSKANVGKTKYILHYTRYILCEVKDTIGESVSDKKVDLNPRTGDPLRPLKKLFE